MFKIHIKNWKLEIDRMNELSKQIIIKIIKLNVDCICKNMQTI